MTGSSYAKGLYQAGEGQLVSKMPNTPLNGTRKGVLCFHGHAADATQFADSSQQPSAHVDALAQAGMIAMGFDAAGPVGWSGPNVMTACTNAYNWLTGAGGAAAGKVAVMGWSMGGLAALNWIKRNPTKVAVAWLWAPVTDLDFFHGTSGYTAGYSAAYTGTPGGNVAAGAWTAEIDTVYGGSSNYAAQSAGFRVRDEYASWHGLGIPIKVCHAPDDQTIPIGQSRDGFVAGVNDPAVTFLQAASGGHTGLFDQVDPSVVIAHYNSVVW